MTYHINGGASSAQLWPDSPWLDFNMAQTFIGRIAFDLVRLKCGRCAHVPYMNRMRNVARAPLSHPPLGSETARGVLGVPAPGLAAIRRAGRM